jgi:hypothetical protein
MVVLTVQLMLLLQQSVMHVTMKMGTIVLETFVVALKMMSSPTAVVAARPVLVFSQAALQAPASTTPPILFVMLALR